MVNKDSMIWINKYKPTNLSQIYGNENKINEITHWLLSF